MEAREQNPEIKARGKLYVITTPIGNYADMTIRAVKALEDCDILICEEFKEARGLLYFFGIEKELLQLNEHNEKGFASEYVHHILEGKSVGLISDCGTPSFADPGNKLINECIAYKQEIEFVHGANSVFAALAVCGFDISRFYYSGFLSPKKDIRRQELRGLAFLKEPFVLLDTPYRLTALLTDLAEIFPDRNAITAFNLTMDDETIFRGNIKNILHQISAKSEDKKLKGEFVIVVDKKNKYSDTDTAVMN
jgi:16S rRNA (cytidine1402-2'-O)-methyltransferase